MKKTSELYNMAKPRIQTKDTPEDIEYERVCDECTFTPDITATKNKTRFQTKKVYAKNIEKTIEKMRNSRQQREIYNWWKEGRGVFPPKFDYNYNDFTMKTKIELSKWDGNNTQNQINSNSKQVVEQNNSLGEITINFL